MITLSNGHTFQYMVASGALGFDGRGWLWERPLVWLGIIRPKLFTVVVKTLTRHPRKGNLCWWKPWTCVRLISGGGVVNKVGLKNRGIEWWCREIAPKINFKKIPTIGSIFGSREELIQMTEMLNRFNFVAIEVNVSCPNTGHVLEQAQMVIDTIRAVKRASLHPIIVKVSVDQDYVAIAKGLVGIAEAISLNSVPWKTVYGDKQSPLWKLEQKVGGGGGGVSGKPAQMHNWTAVKVLAKTGALPVIGPSVMEFEDIHKLRSIGAKAISFGAIHVLRPWAPTSFVRKERRRRLWKKL